jgi:hypothetical protein
MQASFSKGGDMETFPQKLLLSIAAAVIGLAGAVFRAWVSYFATNRTMDVKMLEIAVSILS